MVTAKQFLDSPTKNAPGPVVPIFGAEAYFKQAVIKTLVAARIGDTSDADDDQPIARYPGKTAELVPILDELRTVSMWGDARLVIIDDADEFVTRYRKELERYLEKPARDGLLILELKSWPRTTKLAKKIAADGLDIDCSPLKPAQIPPWLVAVAAQKYGKKLPKQAGQTLVELVGPSLAQLDQELAKLAAFAGDDESINTASVRQLVGGWKAETTWKMLDAVRDGNLADALALLEKLLVSGEPPMKLLGGINYVFRRLARATELARQRRPLAEALKDAGVQPFVIRQSAAYLKRIGFAQAAKIYARLLQADAGLKGDGALPERVVLERLLLQLAGKPSTTRRSLR